MDGSLVSALSPELRRALTGLSGTSPLVIALDFDGTMSPLVDRPEDARPLPASAAAAQLLAGLPGVITALISGRDLRSLEAVYPAPRPQALIGSHGAERVLPEFLNTDAQHIDLDAQQEQLLQDTTQILGEISDAFDGTSLEYKPASTVLHIRQADPVTGQAALDEAYRQLQAVSGLRLLAGKAVLEASVLKTTKGQALQWLRTVTGAQSLIFVGDDVTDEDGFNALGEGDLGIKVGAGQTAAHFRIDAPADLPELLEYLVELRS